jgi:acetyl-CoA carboxylase biotin carboxyl carrier protein
MSHNDKDNDLDKIKDILEIMKANDLEEVEIKHGDDKILLKRFGRQGGFGMVPVPPAAMGPAAAAAGEAQQAIGGEAKGPAKEVLIEIKSPIVGTFYATPSPDSEPFVEVGSKVEENSVVCIIEAMKVMTEIKAEVRGTIAEILVKNGEAVEYGQVLFRVSGV